jgi:PAS domain S-box-containing protein
MGQFTNNEWKLLLDYSEDSLIIVNRDFRIVGCNKKFQDYYKSYFNVEVKIGSDILDYALDGRKDALKKVYEQVFEGQRFEYDIELNGTDGQKSNYHLVYKPATDEHGNVIAALAFGTDISKIIQAITYRNLEDDLRAKLVLSLSDQLELELALVEVIKQACSLMNAKIGEVWLKSRSKPILYKISEWCSDERHSPFLSMHDINFKMGEGLPGKVWQTGKKVQFDNIDANPLFSHRQLVESSGLHAGVGIPIFNDGDISGVLTLFSDVVEVDQELRLEILERLCPFIGLEIARKQSQRDLNHFISKTPVIIGTLGEDGFFKQVNPSLITSSEYSADELLNKPFIEFLHPDDVEPTLQEYERMINGQDDLSAFINRYITKSGMVKWTAWYTSPIPGEEGLYFTFGNDITELIESRERLEELNENLKERNKELALMNDELEQFVYIASHDLQEPLRMITSFLSLLEKRLGDKMDDKSIQYINFAIDGAVRMRSLILDLLKYSRVGREVTLKEFVDLNALLQEVVKLNLPLLTEHNVNISIGNLPGVYGIKSALFQVFQNLIQNAVKYKKTDVTPRVAIEGEELETHWKFKVTDNGIGIDERYFEKIFIIFQRLHTREEYSGTGIGLAICKKIVDFHKGKIWVESVVGDGSTFYFTIAKDQR